MAKNAQKAQNSISTKSAQKRRFKIAAKKEKIKRFSRCFCGMLGWMKSYKRGRKKYVPIFEKRQYYLINHFSCTKKIIL